MLRRVLEEKSYIEVEKMPDVEIIGQQNQNLLSARGKKDRFSSSDV
jgi:hypothetical protein